MELNERYNIHIDSSFRNSGTISNFKTFVTKTNKYKKGFLSLKSLEFPSGSVNQFQSYNSTFIFAYNTQLNPNVFTDVVVNLTPANYNISEFLAKLNTEFINVGFSGFDFSYDQARGKVFITKTSADAWRSIKIRCSLPTFTVYQQLGVDYLGNDITCDVINVNTYMTNEADLVPIKYLYLCTNVLSQNDNYAKNVTPFQILHKILIVGTRNSVTFYESSNLKENEYEISIPTNEWNFMLLDSNNNFIEMNGLNYSFSLNIRLIKD